MAATSMTTMAPHLVNVPASPHSPPCDRPAGAALAHCIEPKRADTEKVGIEGNSTADISLSRFHKSHFSSKSSLIRLVMRCAGEHKEESFRLDREVISPKEFSQEIQSDDATAFSNARAAAFVIPSSSSALISQPNASVSGAAKVSEVTASRLAVPVYGFNDSVKS
jgi:hypothetical protein